MFPVLCHFHTLITKVLVNNFKRNVLVYKICNSRGFRMYSLQLRSLLEYIMLFLIFRES